MEHQKIPQKEFYVSNYIQSNAQSTKPAFGQKENYVLNEKKFSLEGQERKENPTVTESPIKEKPSPIDLVSKKEKSESPPVQVRESFPSPPIQPKETLSSPPKEDRHIIRMSDPESPKEVAEGKENKAQDDKGFLIEEDNSEDKV